jgi:hypothetical protein
MALRPHAAFIALTLLSTLTPTTSVTAIPTPSPARLGLRDSPTCNYPDYANLEIVIIFLSVFITFLLVLLLPCCCIVCNLPRRKRIRNVRRVASTSKLRTAAWESKAKEAGAPAVLEAAAHRGGIEFCDLDLTRL